MSDCGSLRIESLEQRTLFFALTERELHSPRRFDELASRYCASRRFSEWPSIQAVELELPMGFLLLVLSFFARSARRHAVSFSISGGGATDMVEEGEGRREDYGNEAHFQLSMKYSPVERGNIFSRNNGVLQFFSFFLSFLERDYIALRKVVKKKKKKEKWKRNSCLNIYYSCYLQF